MLGSIVAFSQEICDNAIDDDNDGLVDLNDPDCECISFTPSSLIPNPSFEDMSCCPTGEAQLTCADTWIQASTPTTDYLHTCGITSMPFLGYQMPLPVPDGEGAIGFRDGKPGQPNFKEYAGACLTEAMTPGVEYMLDFFIGFHDAPGSMTFDMAIFATTDCNNLPFGGGDQNFGCPTNGPGWVQLGAMTFSGMNEWVDVEFEFEADQAYEAIVLGPACAANPNVAQDPYFFFDDLVLAESSMFGVPLMDVDGNICQGPVTLTTSDTIMGTYQWYKDGVALLGETMQSLSVPNDPDPTGTYEVVVTTNLGCFNGEQISIEIPEYSSAFSDDTCEGDPYEFGGELYTESGTYEANLLATDGCDSLVTLTLTVNPAPDSVITLVTCSSDSVFYNEQLVYPDGTLEFEEMTNAGCLYNVVIDLTVLDEFATEETDSFCFGEGYDWNGETYQQGGEYSIVLPATNGCDSTVTLILTELSASEALISETACTGSVITVNDETYTETGYYQQLLTNSVGCDSFLFIDVIILDSTQETLEESFCGSDSYELNGETYTESGTYEQTLTSVNGCDSILTLELSLLPTFETELEFELCGGNTVELNGEVYDSPGDYTQELLSSLNCDSTLLISIIGLDNTTFEINETICDNDSIVVNEVVYNVAGEYSQVLENSVGCDSTITIQLTVLESYQTDFVSVLCLNDEVTFAGQDISTPGIYTSLLTAENGCDSLIVLDVQVDSTCVECVMASSGATGLNVEFVVLDGNLYDVTFDYLGRQSKYANIHRSELEAMVSIFSLEKERLMSGLNIESCILFDESKLYDHIELVKSSPVSLSKSMIKSYDDSIRDKEIDILDDSRIQGHRQLILNGIDKTSVGKKYAFR